jgi:hypothetical protein
LKLIILKKKTEKLSVFENIIGIKYFLYMIKKIASKINLLRDHLYIYKHSRIIT